MGEGVNETLKNFPKKDLCLPGGRETFQWCTQSNSPDHPCIQALHHRSVTCIAHEWVQTKATSELFESWASPCMWEPRAPGSQCYQVKGSQTPIKERLDATRKVQPPSLSVGDWVRIKCLHHQNKLQPFWSEPLKVTNQLGLFTYRLDDGTDWHANHLHRVTASTSTLSPAVALGWQPRLTANQVERGDPSAHLHRTRVPLVWYGDYVLGWYWHWVTTTSHCAFKVYHSGNKVIKYKVGQFSRN